MSDFWAKVTPGTMDLMYDDVEVLVAVPNKLVTLGGGDEVTLHPAHPYSFFIAYWESERNRWRATETEKDGSPVYLEKDEPTHWCPLPNPAD